jgi:AcrR family transcriptional regulator
VERPSNDGPSATRPRREPLTRERVVAAALDVMDREGLDAVTMRRVGRELGVEAMSLYNHVRDKEDLLDGVVEAVLAGYRDTDRSLDWVERGKAAAREWRRLLRAHPAVITLMTERRHPLTSVRSLRPMEDAADILLSAGLPPDDVAQVYRAVGGYIFGSVMMELGAMVGGGETTPEDLPALPLDELPNLARVFHGFVTCDDDATFEFGLELILGGVGAMLERRP